jgi:hypothetical protein
VVEVTHMTQTTIAQLNQMPIQDLFEICIAYNVGVSVETGGIIKGLVPLINIEVQL